MATVAESILVRLQADAALTAAQPGGLGFLVYDRWLVKTGPGATPDAFDDTRGGRLKRAIVVLDGSENDEAARQPDGLKRLFTTPTTHIFAEAHTNGKRAAQDAYRRIERLLLNWEVVTATGERVGFVSGSRQVLEDSEQFPGNVVLIARWRMTGTRQLIPA